MAWMRSADRIALKAIYIELIKSVMDYGCGAFESITDNLILFSIRHYVFVQELSYMSNCILMDSSTKVLNRNLGKDGRKV